MARTLTTEPLVKQPFLSNHLFDADGNPTGGSASATGLQVSWQHGPLGRGADRKPPNGAFVETLVAVAVDRLQFYQAGKFACSDNAEAIDALNQALSILERRTKAREAQGVEGEHLAHRETTEA